MVNLYDDDCDLRNTYSFSSKYVFTTTINRRGSRIAILLTEAKGDRFSTSAVICEPGKSEKRIDISFSEGLPLGCCFSEDGGLLAVCTDGVFLIDENDGTVKNSHRFENMNISRVSVTPTGAAIAVSVRTGVAANQIFVFDKTGEQYYSMAVDGGMIDMEYFGNYLFTGNQRGTG